MRRLLAAAGKAMVRLWQALWAGTLGCGSAAKAWLRPRALSLAVTVIAAALLSITKNWSNHPHDSALVEFKQLVLEPRVIAPNPDTELFSKIAAVRWDEVVDGAMSRGGSSRTVAFGPSGTLERADGGPLDLAFFNLDLQGCSGTVIAADPRRLSYWIDRSCRTNSRLSGRATSGYLFQGRALALPGTDGGPLDLSWSRTGYVDILLGARSDQLAHQAMLDVAALGSALPIQRVRGVLAASLHLENGRLRRCDVEMGENVEIAGSDVHVLSASYGPSGHSVLVAVDGLGAGDVVRCRNPSPGDRKAPCVPVDDACTYHVGQLLLDWLAITGGLLALRKL
jgi:hypothetical protein